MRLETNVVRRKNVRDSSCSETLLDFLIHRTFAATSEFSICFVQMQKLGHTCKLLWCPVWLSLEMCRSTTRCDGIWMEPTLLERVGIEWKFCGWMEVKLERERCFHAGHYYGLSLCLDRYQWHHVLINCEPQTSRCLLMAITFKWVSIALLPVELTRNLRSYIVIYCMSATQVIGGTYFAVL